MMQMEKADLKNKAERWQLDSAHCKSIVRRDVLKGGNSVDKTQHGRVRMNERGIMRLGQNINRSATNVHQWR
jgi:hypothetical protein